MSPDQGLLDFQSLLRGSFKRVKPFPANADDVHGKVQDLPVQGGFDPYSIE